MSVAQSPEPAQEPLEAGPSRPSQRQEIEWAGGSGPAPLPGGPLTPQGVMFLQRTTGNAAVSRLLQRQQAGTAGAGAPPAPPADAAGAGAGVAAQVQEALDSKRAEAGEGAQADQAAGPPASKEEALATVDRGELAEERAKLDSTAKAEAPKPQENLGAVEGAAAQAKSLAEGGGETPVANRPKDAGGSAPPAPAGEGGTALSAAATAASLADQAYGAAESLTEPELPPPLPSPEPVAPVDAGGKPLAPMPESRTAVLQALVAQAQGLRERD